MKIGINGFGRIGRTLMRVLVDHEDIEVVGINDVADADKLAYLLKHDTVMGPFAGEVNLDGNTLHAGRHRSQMFCEANPEKIGWRECGAQVVVEASGRFRTRAECELHIKAGAKKVLLTVPAKDAIDATIVLGVNEADLKPEHLIISNASCTTNCLAPLAKVLDENFGIEKGLMTTVHAYTNDQMLADYAHKDLRRSRAATENIIPTTTGAAKAVGVVLPQLNGKLDGMAIRVPVADGSAVDLVATLKKLTSVEEINATMKRAAENELQGILQYREDPIVSSDIIKNPHSSIFDAAHTMVMQGRFIKVFSWYDNEWGYCARVADLLKRLKSL